MDADQLDVGSSVATDDGYFAKILEIHEGYAVLHLTGIGYLHDVPLSSLKLLDVGIHRNNAVMFADSRTPGCSHQHAASGIPCSRGTSSCDIASHYSCDNSASSTEFPLEISLAPLCSPLTVDPNSFRILHLDPSRTIKSASLQKSPRSCFYPADENPRQPTPRSPLEVHNNVVKSSPEDGSNFKEQAVVHKISDEKSLGTLKIQRALLEKLLEKKKNSSLLLRCFHLWQMLMYCRSVTLVDVGRKIRRKCSKQSTYVFPPEINFTISFSRAICYERACNSTNHALTCGSILEVHLLSPRKLNDVSLYLGT
eukprot:768272-Hanusia_phi.AAC.19